MPLNIPDTPKVIFERNDLIEAVCQIKVQPILKIGQEVPSAFQDRIRKKYPITESEEGIGINIKNTNVPEVTPQRLGMKWRFVSQDNNWSVTLENSFIAISTRQYVRFSEFLERINEVVGAFNEIYEPSDAERIGIRYINHIMPTENPKNLDDWQKWIRSDLMGFTVNDMVEMPIVRSVAEIRTPQQPGFINVRHGLLPNQQNSQLFYLLDVDRFMAKRVPVSEASAYLDKFNNDCYNFFMWATTSDYQKSLGELSDEG